MPKKTMKADMVEAYLKHMIEIAQQKNVPAKIKRMQIAERMQCTPNLVSYVIHQRLNKNREYLVKAQRGIGGCIEIMNRDQTEEDLLEPQIMTSKRAQQIRKRIENNVNTYIQQEIKPIQKEIGFIDTLFHCFLLCLMASRTPSFTRSKTKVSFSSRQFSRSF